MKQLIGVLLLASTIGLALAATSSASTENTAISCATAKAEMAAYVIAAQKAAHVGDYKTEFRIANAVKALTAAAKTCTSSSSTSSNAPAKFSRTGLPAATPGKPYPPTTFCPHIVSAGTQCDDAAGGLITFTNEGPDLLPFEMRLNQFNGTISGTPRVGLRPQTLRLRVCSERLQDPASRHCDDATLVIK